MTAPFKVKDVKGAALPTKLGHVVAPEKGVMKDAGDIGDDGVIDHETPIEPWPASQPLKDSGGKMPWKGLK